jgi:hypothetical protein
LAIPVNIKCTDWEYLQILDLYQYLEKNISRNELDTIFLSIYKGPSSSQNTGTLHYTSTLITMFLGGTGGSIRVLTKLPNSEQSYKGKVKTHNYINRQNQSTTGKLWKP